MVRDINYLKKKLKLSGYVKVSQSLLCQLNVADLSIIDLSPSLNQCFFLNPNKVLKATIEFGGKVEINFGPKILIGFYKEGSEGSPFYERVTYWSCLYM